MRGNSNHKQPKTKQSNKNKIAQIKYRQNKHTFDENERGSETF